ncbi:hypothetical protein FRC08_011293 [Ceratobasidium sp. 394]|nr:hypothetical protein FRC08_011293 [Ceratobasidium sp. 394]
MLSQRIDQVDQLRTQLAHAEARIASLSARSNPSAALAQAEARAEAAEARLAAIKDGWRGVESYLDMLSRREAEARAAFVRTLGTGEVGVPPSVPVFGAGPASPYLPVRPPVPPNVPNRVGPNTFPALPPAPVVGGPSVIWRHESGHPRRRPGPNDPDDAEPPHKRQRSDRRRDRDREREREVRKEKARFSDSPSPPPAQKEDTDLSPPIAAIAADDKDADGDGEEEVDQIVDDADMAGPTNTTRPRRSSDTAATAPAVRAGSAGARSDGAVKDLKKDGKDAKDPKDSKTNGTNGAAPHDENLDAEGSPETDTDELSVDEELLKLTTKSRRPAREYDGYERPYDEYQSRGPPREDYAREDYREYRGPNAPGANGDPRYHHPGWYEGAYYDGDQYRDPHRPYAPPAPRAEFAQRNGSASSASAPWYAHLKQGSAVATNTQGQRTCRQCGLAGRYKDGKCVEKWGPGPEGPGTVCDRCRKKMKRVERRGTADASMLAGGLGPLPLHQHSFHSQSQSQTQPTQPQTQLSQTQLGTQYSPQRWNGNGRYENGRYDDPRGEKRYDLLPSHYGPIPGAPAAPAAGNGAAEPPPTEEELAIMRRKGGVTLSMLRRKEREASAEKAEAPVTAPAEST